MEKCSKILEENGRNPEDKIIKQGDANDEEYFKISMQANKYNNRNEGRSMRDELKMRDKNIERLLKYLERKKLDYKIQMRKR